MFDADAYISMLIVLLQQRFGTRLVYVGLQGSYQRNEATENSDIDMMVVIDGMTVADLDGYREAIQSLNDAEKSCGFICSKADLKNWNPLEICHLLNSTRDYYGSLSQLVPAYSQKDVLNYVKMSVNNLYHEICHRYLHTSSDKNRAELPNSYKGVFFILQNLYYLKNGKFIPTKAQLLSLLSGKNEEILNHAIRLSNGGEYDFAKSFDLLFTWCQDVMKSL